jgi:hypothetical protein
MADLSINKNRVWYKAITGAGNRPTVPGSNNHTDGSWLPTDIYERELCLNVDDGILYTRAGGSIIPLNRPYESSIQPSISAGDIIINPLNVGLSLFRPRLSVGTRAINTNFDLIFQNYSGARDIHMQYVFDSPVTITLQSFVNVVEEELPVNWTYDSGLGTLTYDDGGSGSKVEISALVDPDDSNSITLRCGGKAV